MVSQHLDFILQKKTTPYIQNINSVHESHRQSKRTAFWCSFNIANKVSADFTNKPETKEPCKIKAFDFTACRLF